MKELTSCCGAYCSDYCCPFAQTELFPGFVRDQLPPKQSPEWIPRKVTRGRSRQPWQIYTVPDWVREGRNRDTGSNLD